MKKEVEALSRGLKDGMFGSRDTVTKAYEYAARIAHAAGPKNEIYVLTAIHVLMNAIADHLDRIVEGKEVVEDEETDTVEVGP